MVCFQLDMFKLLLISISKGTTEISAARETAKVDEKATNEDNETRTFCDKFLDFPKAILRLVLP